MKLTRHNTKQRDRNGGAKEGGTLGRVKKRGKIGLGSSLDRSRLVLSGNLFSIPWRDQTTAAK